VAIVRSESVRTCTGRRARSDVDLAVGRCVAAIKELRQGAGFSIVGPGCAELFSARPCRDAWLGLAVVPPKQTVRSVALGCAPSYCDHLPDEKPLLCSSAVSIEKLSEEDLDDQLVDLLQAAIRCDYAWSPDAERWADFMELFRPQEVEIPTSQAPPEEAKLYVVMITPEKGGKYRITVDGRGVAVTRKVAPAELKPLFAPITTPESKFVIRADGTTPYSVVLAAMRALSDAGFIGVVLDSIP
jgi:biopolymer transport protein ExbD